MVEKIENVKITPVHLDGYRVINIFVHGYKAVTSIKEFEELTQFIATASPRGRTYLIYWKSGSWRYPKWAAALSAAHHLRRFSKGLYFSPAIIAGDLVVHTAYHALDFKLKEKQAEELGRNLIDYISEIPFINSYPINLIGHSLGARAIHYALACNSWREFKLRDCILIGSAADLEDDDWDDCLKQIKGKIYNGYSSKDKILKYLTPDLRKKTGNYPIPQRWRIVNKEFSYGHTEYWPNLEAVLRSLWKKYKRRRS